MNSFRYVYWLELYALLILFSGANINGQKAIPAIPVMATKTTTEGIAAFQQGDLENARRLLAQSLKSNPNDAAAHTYLGILDDSGGNFLNAEKHFAKAAQITPQSASAHNNYGAILLKNNRLPAAKTEFKTSLQIDPKQPNALINLAQIFFNENTPPGLQSAYELFERAANLISDATVERSLVVIALRLKNPAQAANHYPKYAK